MHSLPGNQGFPGTLFENFQARKNADRGFSRFLEGYSGGHLVKKYDLRHIIENQEVLTMTLVGILEFRIFLNLFYPHFCTE